MDNADSTLHRNGVGNASSPIEIGVDNIYARHLGGGVGGLSVNNLSSGVSRRIASPRSPAAHSTSAVSPALPSASQDDVALQEPGSVHGACASGQLPEEGELDQFDIVLQQDAAACSSNPQAPFRHRSPSIAGTHSPSGATPPLTSGGHALSTSSSSFIPSTTQHSGAAGNPPRGSPNVLLQGAGRRLPSVAGACQASAITQDRDQCARLIHQMATACRGELHLHGHTNGSAFIAAVSAASPGGDPRVTTSPATQQQQQPFTSSSTAAAGASGMDLHNFEEELNLLTGIILEANLAHNPQWHSLYTHRSSTRTRSNSSSGAGAGDYGLLPHGVQRASPRGAVASAPLTAYISAATVAPVTVNATVGDRNGVPMRSHSRGSPANGAPVPSLASNYFASAVAHNNNNSNDGRSSIDTEVSDSLFRLSHLSSTGGGGTHHPFSVMEHGVRPMNPCQNGVAAPLPSGNIRSVSQQHHQQLAWPTQAYEGLSSPAHLDRTAIANLGSQTYRRQGGGATRSTSASVKHPRAVKPEVSGEGGRIRGPRSRTGKNVAPSSHSAFSECSGGETRSCRSTLTGAHRVLSSSANVTTNTSLTSSVLHHIQVEHSIAINGSGGGRSSV